MNWIVRVLLILGFISLSGGVIIFYESFGGRALQIPGNSEVARLLALSFWYVEPIIGILLILISRKKMIKLCGAFFLFASICGWIDYFSLK